MYVRALSFSARSGDPRKRIDFALQNTHGDSSSNNSVFDPLKLAISQSGRAGYKMQNQLHARPKPWECI
jgi:hypothetical protein